jgi:copper chaperone CopZ
MEKQYKIAGLTCNGCVGRVSKGLLTLPEVEAVEIDLASGKATIQQSGDISLVNLQAAAGKYEITPQTVVSDDQKEVDVTRIELTTYKPLFLIVGYIALVAGLAQYPFGDFSFMLWMRYFMAGFFIVFSFFKMLNIDGFVMSYTQYDIVAAKWKGWAYMYPFVELILGILYLTNVVPFYTNIATALILGVSTIGVVQSNLNKKKIQCACLGDVFNLPMSTVTIVEDVTMVVMAVVMLLV